MTSLKRIRLTSCKLRRLKKLLIRKQLEHVSSSEQRSFIVTSLPGLDDKTSNASSFNEHRIQHHSTGTSITFGYSSASRTFFLHRLSLQGVQEPYRRNLERQVDVYDGTQKVTLLVSV